jgi:hypothetical protein
MTTCPDVMFEDGVHRSSPPVEKMKQVASPTPARLQRIHRMLLALCDLGFHWRHGTIHLIVIAIVNILTLDLGPPKQRYKHGQFVR